MKKKIAVLMLMVVCLAIVAHAQQDKKKANAALIGTLKSARVIELNFVWDRNSPLLGLNPPFTIGLQTSHKQTSGMIPGGIAFAADMMFFSGQHGSPNVDAVGHISDNMKLFGGVDAAANEGATGLATLGIEAYPKERFINRAVLLDVARFKNVDALAPGQEITAQDLEATAKAQGVEILPGDSVLIRTGYGRFFEADRPKYSGFRPGPGEGAARWLASKRVFLAGDDQMSFEVVPEKGTIFPCHRILIADNGIYIVENLNLEELGRALAELKVYEFALILNPPRIRGATGAAANAFAIIPQ
jgi:kynurenine formamidase